jgi:hypothetical protein
MMTAKDRFAPQEMVTIADALVETGQELLPDSLVGSVVAEIKANPKKLLHERKRKASIAQTKAKALESCRRAVAILSAKASSNEVIAYKDWLLGVGRKIAGATQRGDFLGFGGVNTGESEAAVLNEIAIALQADAVTQ